MAALVIALLFLVSFITSAAAECAWVLWATEIEFTNPNPMIKPVAGRTSRDECEQERVKIQQQSVPWVIFTCLPDTVDPRGPKGK